MNSAAWLRLGPAALVCLAAPAFFVFGWNIVGWGLLAGCQSQGSE